MASCIPNYNKYPVIHTKQPRTVCWQGWEAVCKAMQDAIASGKKIVALECYPGILDEEVLPQLQASLSGTFYYTKDFMLSEEAIEQLVYPDVTDDEVFGYITRLQLIQFFDIDKVNAFQNTFIDQKETVFIYGPGATLLAENYDLLFYLDMPRWEGQLRFLAPKLSVRSGPPTAFVGVRGTPQGHRRHHGC